MTAPLPAVTGISPGLRNRAQEVAPSRTPTLPLDFRAAIARAQTELGGKPASQAQIDILTAHVAHETALGQRMYNYNFGGIKGAGPDGLSARCRTKEFDGTKMRSTIDRFRAYRSLDDGARDYVRLMDQQYPEAVREANQGNVDGFCRALKDRGYFTAPVGAYCSSVRSLVADPSVLSSMPMTPRWDESSACGTGALERTSELEPISSVAVARVVNAVSSAARRIGAPDET